jgi:hypothetical protein
MNAFGSQNLPLMHVPVGGISDYAYGPSSIRENIFAPTIATNPPPFFFQPKSGKLNWREISNVDVDKLIRDVDLKKLEVIIFNSFNILRCYSEI